MNAGEIVRQLKDHPGGPGQWGTEARLMMPGKSGKSDLASRIEHGIALRLRIPFAKSTVTDLKLNGHPVPASEVDGHMSWASRGYRFVQVNIPPERLRQDDVFVITCRYDPGEERAAGVIR
jgi:hypothetical protein